MQAIDHTKINSVTTDISKEFTFLINLPGLFFVKNIDSHFVIMSSDLMKNLGWKSTAQYFDKTDYDIPSKISEIATMFVVSDQKVITNQSVTTLDILHYSTQTKIIIAEKWPLKNEDGKVVGVFYQGSDVTNTSIFKWGQLLNIIDQKIVQTVSKSASYILNPDNSPLPLTARQQSCVFLLIRGKMMREIGTILNISIRTVEAHFEDIKHKLNCYTISQVIEKAISSGFLYYIPRDFINQDIF